MIDHRVQCSRCYMFNLCNATDMSRLSIEIDAGQQVFESLKDLEDALGI